MMFKRKAKSQSINCRDVLCQLKNQFAEVNAKYMMLTEVIESGRRKLADVEVQHAIFTKVRAGIIEAIAEAERRMEKGETL